MRKKNVAQEVRLVDADGDITKRWYVEYYEAGVRKRMYGGMNALKTAAERHEAALKIIERLRGGRKPVPITAAEKAAVDWLREALEAKRRGLRRKTYLTYKSKLEVFALWYGRTKEVPGQADVDRFYAYISAKGLSLTTLNAYRQTLGEFYGIVWPKRDNVFWTRAVYKKTKTPARFFSVSQVARLKAAIEPADPQLWLFIQFMHTMYIRPGELRFLQVGDILFEENKVLVRGEISKNRLQQYVALPEFIKTKILEWEDKPANWYCFGYGGQPGPKPLAMRHMWKRHKAFLDRLGFDTNQYKLYSWKHTGAVAAVRAGVPVKVLQLQLRHHSLDEVEKYLRQMGIDDLMQWRDRLPEV